MAAVLHLGTAHLARVVVLKRQDSGETKARHYVAYGLKVGQKSILGGFERSVIGPKRANRVVPRAVPNPYMMPMLGRGQWVRQGSMRSDARVSGEYATKGLVGERIGFDALRVLVDDHRDLLLLLRLDLRDGGVDLHLLLLEREPLQALLKHLRLARLEL